MAWKVSREGENSFDIFPFGDLATFRAFFFPQLCWVHLFKRRAAMRLDSADQSG